MHKLFHQITWLINTHNHGVEDEFNVTNNRPNFKHYTTPTHTYAVQRNEHSIYITKKRVNNGGTVYEGMIYTIDHFLAIDMLTQ